MASDGCRLSPDRRLLVEGHLYLVGWVWKRLRPRTPGAKRHMRRKGTACDDVFQQGYLGLCLAAVRYRPERGCKFTTYAVPYVHGFVYRAVYGFPRRRPPPEAVPLGGLDFPAPEADPDADPDVAACLASLPTDARDLVRLRFWGGLTLREIASRCGFGAYQIAQVKLNAALAELRPLLSPGYEA